MKRTEHTFTDRLQAVLELDEIVSHWALERLLHPDAQHNRWVNLCKMGFDDYRVIVVDGDALDDGSRLDGVC